MLKCRPPSSGLVDAPPPTLATFARKPRDALMWPPRAADVAAIAEVCRTAGPRVVDVGAGTGLLARLLLEEGVEVEACDPEPAPVAYASVARRSAEELEGPYDAVIVSWMEAGKDYRKAVARLAPVVVNAYDPAGACGVKGEVDMAPFGFVQASFWETPSFEDVAFVMDRPGRGLKRPGAPGNRVDVLTRYKALVPALREAVAGAQAGEPYEWEVEMERLGV